MKWIKRLGYLVGLSCALLACGPSFAVGGDSWHQRPWAIAAYFAKMNTNDLGSTLMFQYQPRPSRLLAAEVSYAPQPDWWFQQVFKPLGAHVEFALNVAAVKDHIKYVAINPYLALRFASFPWNGILFTTFAAGEGLSYANCVPPSEIKPQFDIHSTRFLNYLMFELSFSEPKHKALSFLIRVHHRSGAFGLYYPYRGKHACGSNYYGFGLRFALADFAAKS